VHESSAEKRYASRRDAVRLQMLALTFAENLGRVFCRQVEQNAAS
jgi:hypothetical protein